MEIPPICDVRNGDAQPGWATGEGGGARSEAYITHLPPPPSHHPPDSRTPAIPPLLKSGVPAQRHALPPSVLWPARLTP